MVSSLAPAGSLVPSQSESCRPEFKSRPHTRWPCGCQRCARPGSVSPHDDQGQGVWPCPHRPGAAAEIQCGACPRGHGTLWRAQCWPVSHGEAGGTVPWAPDGSSTCQEPRDQELEVRRGGSWLLGGRARGGSAEGGRSQALGPGKRCHLHPRVPSSLPSLFSGLQSLPLCCPTQGRALKNSDADTLLGEGRALFGGHNTPVPAAGAPLPLRHSGLCVAPGLPCRLSAPLGERAARGLGI